MEIVVTIRGIISAGEVSRLQRLLEVLYPEARVRVISGSHAAPVVGPSEFKEPEWTVTATE